MIELYHCVSARSFRPLWALEAIGVSYNLNMLPFPPRVEARHYLEINPIGTVPALVTDGKLLMTESVAICEYLVRKYGTDSLCVAPDEQDYASYLNWLHYGEATLTFPQTIILRYGKFEPMERRLPQAVQDYSKWFLGRLRAIDYALEKSDYLCENRFTVADISVGYALMLADFIGFNQLFPVNVRRYWTRLSGEPSYRRALVAQELAALQQGVSLQHSPLTGDT